jgi:hypothetical protein
MRTAILAGIVALVGVIVVIATQIGGGRPAPDFVGGAPGVFRDAPFSVRLAGPLWRARTLQDVDGAQDFALIERNLALDVRATGNSVAPVAEFELRVDGQSKRVVVPPCPSGSCPVSAGVRFVAPLRSTPPGPHRIEIVVRDPDGVADSSDPAEHVATFGFEVLHVTSVPPTREGRTISKLPAPPPSPGVPARLRRAALGVLTAARRGGAVGAALGHASVSVAQAGRLDAVGRRLGVSMLVTVTPPLHDVRATVPAYVPVVGSGGVHYRTQQVQMHIAVLRDALIDVDLTTRKVITFEPGPRSRTLSWSPSRAPTPAGARGED